MDMWVYKNTKIKLKLGYILSIISLNYLCLPATKETRDEVFSMRYLLTNTLGLCQNPFVRISCGSKPLANATEWPIFLTSWPAGAGVRGAPSLIALTSQ